ncbi:MAG: hypothetical protein FIA97_06855 [Methylococcaceae bacterium]|nr:hypothetical protein [Methylococcaceae bacterium]
MMTDWYRKAIDALQLNGLCPRSQEAYVRAVRMLVEFTGKTPDDIGEPELQQYFLHRKNQDRWSPNTLRICYCGIRHLLRPCAAPGLAHPAADPGRERTAAAGGVEPGGGGGAVPLRSCPPTIWLFHRLQLRFAAAGGAVPGGVRH